MEYMEKEKLAKFRELWPGLKGKQLEEAAYNFVRYLQTAYEIVKENELTKTEKKPQESNLS